MERELPQSGAPTLPQKWRSVCTPLNIPEWSKWLASFPDPRLAGFLLRGFKCGFRIGCKRNQAYRPSCSRKNMTSAYDHPEVISDYLHAESQAGRLVGPLDPKVVGLCTSPFGVIPKKSNPGKWRLILDLSSPNARSVNDGIDPDLCSVHYSGLDEAIAMISSLGRGTQLAKIDLKNAYRIIPVHPDDRLLLGMSWGSEVFLDAALPFGLRSAPKIFSAVADVLLWVMAQRGVVEGIHYLDDFLFAGRANSDACAHALSCALNTCRILGVPVAAEKIEGPASCVSYLGILIDTSKGELRLPEAKLTLLLLELEKWQNKKACTKRELLSLIGRLHHAASVVRPGRPFTRSLIELSKIPKQLNHMVRLNRSARADIEWWRMFAKSWNGINFLPFARTQITLTSDASGSWGCGAFYDARWFHLQWSGLLCPQNIAAMELLPILLASAMWGPNWQAHHILCQCDNQAVVAVLNKGSAKDLTLAHILRCISFYAAHYGFSLSAVHVPGEHNRAADALSRNNVQLFLSILPQAQPMSDLIPPEVVQMAARTDLDWTAPSWKALFMATLLRV